jgi:hypothetical protein
VNDESRPAQVSPAELFIDFLCFGRFVGKVDPKYLTVITWSGYCHLQYLLLYSFAVNAMLVNIFLKTNLFM